MGNPKVNLNPVFFAHMLCKQVTPPTLMPPVTFFIFQKMKQILHRYVLQGWSVENNLVQGFLTASGQILMGCFMDFIDPVRTISTDFCWPRDLSSSTTTGCTTLTRNWEVILKETARFPLNLLTVFIVSTSLIFCWPLIRRHNPAKISTWAQYISKSNFVRLSGQTKQFNLHYWF